MFLPTVAVTIILCLLPCLCLKEFAINKWACDCVVTRAMQDAYMAEVLPALDRHPAVERYAWYTARDSPDEPGGVHTPVGGALDARLRQAWHRA